MRTPIIMDAQAALSFLLPQITHIETQVYAAKYPSIVYPSIIPVDTSANPWTPTVTYFSTDGVGRAAWFNGKARDIPNVEQTRAKAETSVRMSAIGYSYDTEELQHAQLLGINLNADKATSARRIAEEHIEDVALYGDAKVGFGGFLNNGEVPVVAAPAVSGSAKWVDKTPKQIMADVNATIGGIFTTTNTVGLADTLLLPDECYNHIATTPMNELSDRTILDFIRAANIYTARTGQPLTIRSVRGLATAGTGGAGRLVAYRRSPEVLKLHMPMPFRFLPVWQSGPMTFDVPGIFRFGGTDVRLPLEMLYMDGVA